MLGFVFGKFYPPHLDHKHLIDSTRKQVDELIVMLAILSLIRLASNPRQISI